MNLSTYTEPRPSPLGSLAHLGFVSSASAAGSAARAAGQPSGGLGWRHGSRFRITCYTHLGILQYKSICVYIIYN